MTAEQATRDPLAVLEEIRERNAARVVRASDVERLLAILDALLKAHRIEPVYEAAENCVHPEPDRVTAPAGWGEWADDHAPGTDNAGEDSGDRICLLTQTGTHCAGCSEWLAREYGSDDFVHPGNCLVRPLVAAALTGEEAPAS